MSSIIYKPSGITVIKMSYLYRSDALVPPGKANVEKDQYWLPPPERQWQISLARMANMPLRGSLICHGNSFSLQEPLYWEAVHKPPKQNIDTLHRPDCNSPGSQGNLRSNTVPRRAGERIWWSIAPWHFWIYFLPWCTIKKLRFSQWQARSKLGWAWAMSTVLCSIMSFL